MPVTTQEVILAREVEEISRRSDLLQAGHQKELNPESLSSPRRNEFSAQ
jgi:hypothetical protein